MNMNPVQPFDFFPMMGFFPLFMFSLPAFIVMVLLALNKGRSVVLWGLLGIIPFFSYICMFYIIGASNLRVEKKIDRILEILEKNEPHAEFVAKMAEASGHSRVMDKTIDLNTEV